MTDQPPAMTGAQIRQLYLDYFQGREHLVMPSSSLIPAGDPTLLLTTAGMVQMKPYFLGEVSPPSRRMTSAQKCFRTTDIDTVGDHKHLTFFEMLGNFSVGDYFKEGAIGFAWEFVTQRLGLDPGRLWVTVYLDDDEAYDLWHERIGVPEERIYRYGRGDNWWGPPGLEGPCGPCSEIHYDFGRALGCADAATAEVIAEWERGGNTGEQPGCHPNCDRCERFVELWNLVFMQFFQDTAKELTPLPAPNIDTGMGLERAAVILQNARTVYDTDLFQPIVQRVCELAVKEYGRDAETDRAVRVVAEHARGAAFLITDGVVPGNDGRGYVLRRLIRRAVRFGRKLGLTDAFLAQLAEVVVEQMGGAYPELAENREFVLRVLALEEERFGETLERGLLLFKGFRNEMTRIGAALREEQSTLPVTVAEEHDVLSVNKTAFFLGPEQRLVRGDSQMTEAELSGAQLVHDVLIDRFDLFEYYEGYLGLKLPMNPSTFAEAFSSVSVETAAKFLDVVKLRLDRSQENVQRARQLVPGKVAFDLSATYGFPPEETEAVAQEEGFQGIDWEELREQEAAHQEISRAGGERFEGEKKARIYQYRDLGVEATRFLGYDRLEQETVVVGILGSAGPVASAQAGDEVELALRESPFYAEGGGQVGDSGVLAATGGRVDVTGTHAPIAGLIMHKGRVVEGSVALGDAVTATVDGEHRRGAARNHTATHLAHAALRQVLGTHVRQAGSLVAPDRLRFDFSHVAALSQEELTTVERLVNEQVRRDLQVRTRETGYADAVRDGALAFFGDKYGKSVRVVRMGDNGAFSFEVCGGTHLEHTSEVGLFLITGEGSIGSGLRRMEAVTGRAAEELARANRGTLESVARTLETTPVELAKRAAELLEELDAERKRGAALERQLARRESEALLDQVQEVASASTGPERRIKVLTGRVDASSADAVREVGDYLRDKLGSGVVVLGAVLNDRPTMVAMVTPDLVALGVSAVAIVREAAKVIEGGGGGRPELAQAGGKRVDLLDGALARVPELVKG